MFDFRDRKIRRFYVCIVLCLLCGMLLASGYALRLIHRQKIENGLDLSSIQARIFEDYLTQSLNTIDLALRNTPLIWDSGLSPDQSLTLALSNAPYLRSISLINEHGIVLASSNPRNVGYPIGVANFLPGADKPAGILRIGTPWTGRDLQEGQPASTQTPAAPDALVFLPVIRDVSIHNQAYRLLATVNTDYFINHFSQMIPAETGYIEAIRLDGILLFSTHDQHSPGSQHPSETDSHSQPPVFAKARASDTLLSSHQASRTFPFVIGVHLDRATLLAPWQAQLKILLGVVSLSALAVIVFSIFIYRRLMHTARLQQAADEQLNLSAQVFKSSAEAIFIATAEQRIFSVNRAFSEITGYSASEIIGSPPAVLDADQNTTENCPPWEEIGKNRPWMGEISHRRKNGETYPAYMTVSCIQNDAGKITHYIGVFSDATERKISERFRYLSEHDYLTGLPNRRLFEEHIEQAIARIERYGGRVAILFLDLDRFKQVNDTLGHHVGDLLLKEVADRMRTCVRATDSLCRQGGDEFLLMVDVTDALDDASHVAQKLVDAIGRPFELAGTSLHVTPSIGISLCPDHGIDTETLIRCADTAMYETKYHGRNHFEFYQPEMDAADRSPA